MTTAYKKLGQGTLTGSGTKDTLYTVPAGTETIVRHIRFVNYDTSNATLEVWHDGTADANLILPSITVEAGGWVEMDAVITMEAADTLKAEAGSATAITYTVYGVEVT